MTRLARALIRFALVCLLVVGRSVQAGAIEVCYVALWPAMTAHDRWPAYFRAVTVANVAAIAAAVAGLLWIAL
jgi:hypothetical protein